LESRALPYWTYSEELAHTFPNGSSIKYYYFDLCPHTPTIFMSVYWDDLHKHPKFPKTKKVWWMVNVEMIGKDREHFIQETDMVLCRTLDCEKRFNELFKQRGNRRNTTVFYTSGVTSDISALTRYYSGDSRKNFSTLSFLHVPGSSPFKGTEHIMRCWAQRKDFPTLIISTISDQHDNNYKKLLRNNTNVVFQHTTLSLLGMAKLFADIPVILCPSSMEGYGHYINKARASGALLVTTNLPPMNEFIDSNSGVLVQVTSAHSDKVQVLGDDHLANVLPISADLKSEHICDAVEEIIRMSPAKRKMLAIRGRERYEKDVMTFQTRLNELRKIGLEMRVESESK